MFQKKRSRSFTVASPFTSSSWSWSWWSSPAPSLPAPFRAWFKPPGSVAALADAGSVEAVAVGEQTATDTATEQGFAVRVGRLAGHRGGRGGLPLPEHTRLTLPEPTVGTARRLTDSTT